MFPLPVLLSAVLLFAAVPACFAAATPAPSITNAATERIGPTFESWKAACAKLPSNRSLQGRWPSNRLLPLPRFADFDEVLAAFFAQCQKGTMSQVTNWVGPIPTAK